MKIEIDEHNEFLLSEVYTGIGIKTDAGLFAICQRDGGIEIRLNDGPWFEWKSDDGPNKEILSTTNPDDFKIESI